MSCFAFMIYVAMEKLVNDNNNYDENKTRYKMPKLRSEDARTTFVKRNQEGLTKENMSSKCKYCGEKIEEDIAYCPFCGSNLSE